MGEESSKRSKSGGDGIFRQTQSRFRRRADDPDRIDDLDELLDFSRCSIQGPQTHPQAGIFRLPTVGDLASRIESSSDLTFRLEEKDKTWTDGTIPQCRYYDGPIFGLQAYPGFLFAPNALSKELQDMLAYEAVRTYCERPYVTNIDGVPPKPFETVNDSSSTTPSMDTIDDDSSSMWMLWKKEQGFLSSAQTNAKSIHSNCCQRKKPRPKPKINYYRSFRKLSWATMGYHYDWTARSYNKMVMSDMPRELNTIGKIFAFNSWLWETSSDALSSSSSSSTCSTTSNDFHYTASACIVNYYSAKSAMGPHRDDLEHALTKPIISFSMGRPAVFLLGGTTKDDDPVLPILVRPGDVMIMGGKSRLNYHSMARLLPADGGLVPCRQEPCCPCCPASVNEKQPQQQQKQQQLSLEHVLGANNNSNSSGGRSAASDKDLAGNPYSSNDAVTAATAAAPPLDMDIHPRAPDIRSADTEKQALAVFLSHHRININLRQVYDTD